MVVLSAKIKVFHVRIETKGQWECTFDQLLILLGWNERAETSFREITPRCDVKKKINPHSCEAIRYSKLLDYLRTVFKRTID